MYSTKLSVSIHILSVIVLMEGQPVTSEYIASSINTNPALVRRLMSRLKKAKLIKNEYEAWCNRSCQRGERYFTSGYLFCNRRPSGFV